MRHRELGIYTLPHAAAARATGFYDRRVEAPRPAALGEGCALTMMPPQRVPRTCRVTTTLYAPLAGSYICQAAIFLGDGLARNPPRRRSRWHRGRVGSQAVLVLLLWSSQAVRFTSLGLAPLALKAATTEPPPRRSSNTSAPCSMV